MSATKEFGLAGIIGMPVAHSRSPVVHNYWLEEHGLAGRYVLLPVKPERLAEALKGLVALGFRGVNVTTPHKQAVMPLLDHVDPMATRIGAVNTIVVEPDGTLRGFNNDGNGFVQALRDEKPDWRPDDGPIVVVGAGGAARAILVALASQGAKEIRLVNRTRETADTLAHALGGPIEVVPWEHRAQALAGAATLINATTQGSAGKPPLDLRSTRCRATQSSATRSTCRRRRRCSPPRRRAAIAPSTGSACCSTRRGRRSRRGSARCRRSRRVSGARSPRRSRACQRGHSRRRADVLARWANRARHGRVARHRLGHRRSARGGRRDRRAERSRRDDAR
jgi:shikimate dehydrogenase